MKVCHQTFVAIFYVSLSCTWKGDVPHQIIVCTDQRDSSPHSENPKRDGPEWPLRSARSIHDLHWVDRFIKPDIVHHYVRVCRSASSWNTWKRLERPFQTSTTKIYFFRQKKIPLTFLVLSLNSIHLYKMHHTTYYTVLWCSHVIYLQKTREAFL